MPKSPADFDAVLADYLPELKKPRPSAPSAEAAASKPTASDGLDGLL